MGVAGYPFLQELNAEIKRKASMPVTVDLSEMTRGEVKTVFWSRKPVLIKYLSEQDIESLKRDNEKNYSGMLDPEPAKSRITNENWLVVSGICTHLGCSIKYTKEDSKFRCACHGSFFDSIGRVLNGPASVNLIIPPHRFIDEKTLIIGHEETKQYI